MYTGKTIPEAARKWQADAMFHISRISYFMGIHIERRDTKWVESAKSPGLYYKKGERDTVQFPRLCD